MSTLTAESKLILLTREKEPTRWKTPVVAALAIQATLILVGYYSPKQTFLDLINQGETLAVAPSQPVPEQKEIELDLTPLPPPETNPDFVKPQEVVPKIAPPVIKPKPALVVKTQPPAPAYAASGIAVGNHNCPKPPYPYEAKEKRFQGTVVISISVVNGTVVDAEVSSSSGYGILDNSAASWIRQHWKFPDNLTVSTTVPVRFELGV